MSKIFIGGGGGILVNIYHWTHPKVSEDKIPYWYKRSITGVSGQFLDPEKSVIT